MLTLELRKDDHGQPGDLLAVYSKPTRNDALMHIYNTIANGGFDPYFWIPRNPRERELIAFEFENLKVRVEYDKFGSPRIMLHGDEWMKGEAFGL